MQHSRYIDYALAIAKRDDMLLLMLGYVVVAFVLATAVSAIFPRIKREWLLVGGFYATLAIAGAVSFIASH